MTRIAAERGYNLSRYIAAQVTADDLAWADDVVVTFDLERERVLRTFREKRAVPAGWRRNGTTCD
jgi:protein-tyrosine-phosphatase